MNPFPAALLLFALVSCAHQPQHHTAPDAAPLLVRQHELAGHVKTAQAGIAKAATSLESAKAGHARETAALLEMAATADTLFRNAPPELRELATRLQAEVETLKTAQAVTDSHIAATEQAQAAGLAAMALAVKAQADIEGRLGPDYLAKVDLLAARANTAERAWAKDSAEVLRLRTQSWLGRILMAGGALAVLGIAFLWFTGRIAKAGGEIAAKL